MNLEGGDLGRSSAEGRRGGVHCFDDGHPDGDDDDGDDTSDDGVPGEDGIDDGDPGEDDIVDSDPNEDDCDGDGCSGDQNQRQLFLAPTSSSSSE